MYISVVSLPVDDVDRAIDFYVNKLGWEKTMDVPMGESDRWVMITPSGGQTAFTLSKETLGESRRPADGHSGVIVHVDDVYETHDKLSKAGVEFSEEPRTEPWGGWASFKDSEGNIHGLHSPVAATVSAN